MKLIDLTGKQFGRLTVVTLHGRDAHRISTWLCRCECGNSSVVSASRMKRGRTKSCGCLMREVARANLRGNNHGLTHGHSRLHKQTGKRGHTPEYITWRGMLQRCNNPSAANFQRYGGRGISVCERWESFENFLADMGPRPPAHTIDRIDVNGHYESGNVRWATAKEQTRNRRRGRWGPSVDCG
jgi:hypothetical protein